MTKEEAIRLIKDHIDTYVVCHGEEDTVAVSIDNVDVEAFDMAIKALEQQPCEDAVSREAVFRMLRGCLTGGEKEYEYVKLHIDSLPFVQPKSSWISIKDEEKPKDGQRVFILLKDGRTYTADFNCDNSGWWFVANNEWEYSRFVKAWMPIPEDKEGE